MSFAGWVLVAAAGSGSSGFSSGGGGGGGGSSSGGGSSTGVNTGGGGSTLGGWILVGVIVLAVVLVTLLHKPVRERFVARRARVVARRVARADAARAAREEQIIPAALEAAQDDEAFAPDRVRREAEELFRTVQHAWTHDHNALAALVGTDLLEEWRRRLKGLRKQQMFNRITVEGPVHVRLVGLRNVEDDAEDRVVVFVSAVTTDVVSLHGNRHKTKNRKGQWGPHVALTEYWTLGKRDGGWVLLSIEQAGEGAHQLQSELVARPDADTALRDSVVNELATADAAPAGATTGLGALVDVDLLGDARAAALDLSLVDGRFAPEVLEAGVRRVLEGWLEAVDGPDAALAAVAAPGAVAALLFQDGRGRGARTVVRGARADEVAIRALDGEATPPRMEVEVALRGNRYVEDRTTTTILRGDRDRETTWRERWTLELSDAPTAPWRLAAVAAGARGSS